MSAVGGSEASRASRISARGLVAAAPAAARHLVYALVLCGAVVFALLMIRSGIEDGIIGYDFEGTLWDPAVAILDGRSPYPAPVVTEVEVGNPALYPPLLMLLVAPLTVLPFTAGLVVWIGLSILAVAATLYVLEVRDPRVYVLALISTPPLTGLVWGNATLMLLPLVALAWRWRSHPVRSGLLVGVGIAAKLFLWPLAFWLLGTRRYRAAAAAMAAAGLGLLLPWAAIGFDGMSTYRDLLGVAEDVYAVHSYSTATALSGLGVGTGLAVAVTVALGLVVASLALVAGRRGMDELSLGLAILAAILGSPILWEHYYALLLVPLAIARPRFSALWLLPVLFYVTHRLPRDRLPASELEPGGTACCKPDDVPLSSWVINHAPPGLWPAVGHVAIAVGLVIAATWPMLRTTDEHDRSRPVSS